MILRVFYKDEDTYDSIEKISNFIKRARRTYVGWRFASPMQLCEIVVTDDTEKEFKKLCGKSILDVRKRDGPYLGPEVMDSIIPTLCHTTGGSLENWLRLVRTTGGGFVIAFH